ncbi:MAG: YfhO family protein [Chitinophagales bacterium]|nr:YfhO family protein [Chitinophagales bacterium]
MRKSRYNDISAYLFLLLVTVIAYWPVSSMAFSLKNDAINYFLAMRYNTSEAIQHGYFPSWSAYINMGYPLHADMQSGVWNPFVILMSLIRQYDIYWLHIETILVIFMAGIGMYRLLRHLQIESKIAIIIGAAYILNGYISDAGQFLNWLYAAAIFPFVFLNTIRCFSKFTIKSAFLLGLSMSLMLLCAYPADFIITIYIVAGYTLATFIGHWRQTNFQISFKRFLVPVSTIIITFLITCLPAILSYIPFLESINRGKGVSIDVALTNSMAPANFISLLAPWATQAGKAFEATDPLIRNCYLGLIPFAFFIWFLIKYPRKNFVQKFLITLFILMVLFSLGEMGILRVLSYKFLPLMDSFRHPANAKLFFIFSGQILSAYAINYYVTNPEKGNATLNKIIISFFFIILGLFGWSLFNSNILSRINDSKALFNANNLKQVLDDLQFADYLFLNSILALVIIGVSLLCLKKDILKKWLPILLLADMIIVCQGMLPLTFVRKTPPSEAQSIINKLPKGYPIPDAAQSVKEFSKDGMAYFDQIGCLNPYNKKPGRSDYVITPSNLSTQEGFWDYITFREKIIEYPFVYFADTLLNVRDTASFIKHPTSKRVAFVESNSDKLKTTNQTNTNSISITKFNPGLFRIECKNENEAFLVIQQNKYPNWYATINGKKTSIHLANLSFMGIVVPPGNNTIQFTYREQYLLIYALASLCFVCLGFVLLNVKRKK